MEGQGTLEEEGLRQDTPSSSSGGKECMHLP